jgi:hypothetical protein
MSHKEGLLLVIYIFKKTEFLRNRIYKTEISDKNFFLKKEKVLSSK